MLRLVLLASLVFASAASGGTGTTRLRVTVWPKGPASPLVHRYTVACAPARGTVPHPARACKVLRRRGPAAFAPAPRNVACTDIYGGPARAHVRGLVAGHRVDARLRLTNGCEIARWNRVGSVVPRS